MPGGTIDIHPWQIGEGNSSSEVVFRAMIRISKFVRKEIATIVPVIVREPLYLQGS